MVIVSRLKVLLSLRVIMCAFLLLIGVHSGSAQVSLTTNQTNLKTVIQRIKSKTKYRFFYDDELKKHKVNAVSISNLSIDFVLDRLFEGTGMFLLKFKKYFIPLFF